MHLNNNANYLDTNDKNIFNHCLLLCFFFGICNLNVYYDGVEPYEINMTNPNTFNKYFSPISSGYSFA